MRPACFFGPVQDTVDLVPEYAPRPLTVRDRVKSRLEDLSAASARAPTREERSNPTLGFHDRMGGERLTDDRGQFSGAYGWRDARTLLGQAGDDP